LATSPAQRAARATKIAAIAGVAALLIAAQRLGLFDQLAAPARFKETLLALGPWGYVAFLAAYAALQPFGIPGTVFVLAAALVWPWPVAFALSMIGTMAASSVGFTFARFIARDWVAARIPARFRRYDEALEREAFKTIAALRFVFWMPPLLHAFFGVSRVRFWAHFWGSFVGYLVPLFLMSYFGQRLFDALSRAPIEAWIGLGVAIGAVAVGVWAYRRRGSRRALAGATAVVPLEADQPRSSATTDR
jgi:uncharacterized membrane protein YdjX (TVP38/TMEM64 family)